MIFGKKNAIVPAAASVPVTPPDNKALVNVPAQGSIQAVGGNSALALLKAKVILVCDRSGSMATADAMHGKPRYEVEDTVVADLQKKYPGQIVIEAFADSAILCLNGNLPYPDGSATVMSNAFELAGKMLRPGMHAILLTDGEATDPEDMVLKAAKPLAGRLDIIYIGPDHGPGRLFLERLAKETSGTFQHNQLKAGSQLLEKSVETLMLKSGVK